MYLIYEVETDEKVIPVKWQAFPRWENDGIGSYEYWGQKCFDRGNDYVSLEYNGCPTWDKSKHTEEENTIIQQWVDVSKNSEKLEERFCDEYKATAE